MSEVLTLTEIAPTRDWVRGHQRAGRSVGLVPTMGALHAGHLSLATAAREACDAVLVTVFVNPTQFGPGEDFDRYPRDLDRDLISLDQIGVDAVFAPAVETMYPTPDGASVDPGPVAEPFEGRSRPHHFSGVATVVAKLFSIAPADRAYFGQKDYQQTVVLRRMAADLCLPTEIVVCPTIREPDGLAMSSRNAYLNPEQRESALALHRGLRAAEALHAAGERDPVVLKASVAERLAAANGVELDYVALVTDGTVEEPQRVEGPSVVLVAARVGQTRLIDNARLP